MDEVPQSDNPSSETQVLGGNIELAGFRELDGGSMIVLKKIIGNYARRFSDQHGSEKLVLELAQENDVFAVNGAVQRNGKEIKATDTNKNVFFVVDTVLKQLESQLQ